MQSHSTKSSAQSTFTSFSADSAEFVPDSLKASEAVVKAHPWKQASWRQKNAGAKAAEQSTAPNAQDRSTAKIPPWRQTSRRLGDKKDDQQSLPGDCAKLSESEAPKTNKPLGIREQLAVESSFKAVSAGKLIAKNTFLDVERRETQRRRIYSDSVVSYGIDQQESQPSSPSASTCVGSPASSTCAESQASFASSRDSDSSDHEQAFGDEGLGAGLHENDEEGDLRAPQDLQERSLPLQELLKFRHALDADAYLDHRWMVTQTIPALRKSQKNGGCMAVEDFDCEGLENAEPDEKLKEEPQGQASKLNVNAKPFAPSSPSSPTSTGAWPRDDSLAQGGRDTTSELCISKSSWVAQQTARRKASQAAGSQEDKGDVVRTIKSILNKLTIENFPQLYQKLLSCGMRTASHVESLIHEVFEKATTQHVFINVYADLCVQLHAHFVQHPITDDPKMFKSLLLNACQASFERHLKTPVDPISFDQDLEQIYKVQMLGNIKFVGALLVRQLLATKVMLGIVEQLFAGKTPLMLELLAALLTVIGPAFDTPEKGGKRFFETVFNQLRGLSKDADLNPRVRCLLKDVIELREAGWQQRPHKMNDGPTTLKEVADNFAAEEAEGSLAAAAALSRPPGRFDWRSGP